MKIPRITIGTTTQKSIAKTNNINKTQNTAQKAKKYNYPMVKHFSTYEIISYILKEAIY